MFGRAVTPVRPSPIAGQWYPARPEALAAMVDGYLAAAAEVMPPLDGEVIGLVAPHAGIQYSGPVAGYAFAAVQGQAPEVVAVLSPMHYPYEATLLTTAHEAYATPLGEVPVAHDLLAAWEAAVQRRGGEAFQRVANDPEHALEMELPFLQRALRGAFFLLPLMMRDYRPEVCRAVGEALAEVLADRPALVVASSDLSHYYPETVARPLDEEMLRRVAAMDPLAVLEAEARGVGFACGAGPIASMLWATKAMGARRAVVLKRASSGDVTGDTSAVVGYGAVAVLR